MGNINFKRLIRDASSGMLIMTYNNTNIWYDEHTHKYGVDVQCKDKTGKPIMKTRRKQFSTLQLAKEFIDTQQ